MKSRTAKIVGDIHAFFACHLNLQNLERCVGAADYHLFAVNDYLAWFSVDVVTHGGFEYLGVGRRHVFGGDCRPRGRVG
jgi:hypothetical protein